MYRHIFVLAAIALVSAGCQQRLAEKRMARDANFCQSIGAVQGTPAFTQCMLQRDAQNQANAQASAAVNQQIINNALIQPQVQRPVHTTCTRGQIAVTCTTF